MASNFVVIAVAIGLAACQQNGGGSVQVSGNAQDLRFSTMGTISGERPCARTVSVTPVTPDDAEPVWQTMVTDPAQCASALRYGRSPDGFSDEHAAAALRLGVKYRVRLSGGGFSLVRDFHLTAQGVQDDG